MRVRSLAFFLCFLFSSILLANAADVGVQRELFISMSKKAGDIIANRFANAKLNNVGVIEVNGSGIPISGSDQIFDSEVVNALTRHDIKVIDRSVISSIVGEKKLTLSGLVSNNLIEKVSKMAGINYFSRFILYSMSCEPAEQNWLEGIFIEKRGYVSTLKGSFKVVGLDSSIVLSDDFSTSSAKFKITKYVSRPAAYIYPAVLTGGIMLFSAPEEWRTNNIWLTVCAAAGLIVSIFTGDFLYKHLP
ncbi:MAG: hypothetical protein DRP50_05925 [Thermotoga sp.]|nr:MAG: hypothetical protein DRP50_05925 [Thermotoga sp.]